MMVMCWLLLFTGAKALTYVADTMEEPITYTGHVTAIGDGKIESTTFTPLASDAVDSRGASQEYNRSFNIGGKSESESFNSEYSLKNGYGYRSSYMATMHGENEMLQHEASIEGSSDINSIVSINRGPIFDRNSDAESIVLSDLFRISGNESKIRESVIDQKLSYHPVALVDTLAQGRFVSISSELAKESNGFSAEFDRLKAKLLPVNKVIKSVFGNAMNATEFIDLGVPLCLRATRLKETKYLDESNLTANMVRDFELNAIKIGCKR